MEGKPTYELTVVKPSTLALGWQELKEIATIFHKSGLTPNHFKTPEQVISACVVARDLGLPISTVLQGGLYVVNGVVSTDSKTMMALIMRANGEVKVNIEKDDAQGWVEVTMSRPSVGISYKARWDEARVGISRVNMEPGGKEKWPWKQHRQTMKTWRAIAEAARVVAPDLIGGLYLADEVDVPVRVEGEEMVIEAEAIELPPSEETAEIQKEKKSNGWPTRPWDASTLKQAMAKKITAYKGKREKPSDDQLDYCRSSLAKLNLADPERHTITLYLFGVESTGDLTAAQCSALIDWISAKEENEYKPSQDAKVEARAVIKQYQIEQGQQEMALA